MSLIEKPDFKQKRNIPASMKLALMLAVIIGIWGRSCWRSNELKNIIFDNIVIENPTPVSVDIIFEVYNNTSQKGQKAILIEIFTNTNELLSSRITSIEINPKQRNKFVRVIDKFQRPLSPNEEISHANVKLYQKSAFK